jgi:hypothetical protein
MIYLSFGMLKSASTLTYQLTEEILRQAGRAPCILRPPLRPALSVTNYFDNIDLPLIRRIQKAAQGRDVVIKTHQLPAPEVLTLVERGEILASASFRDPREIALSMVDHGERSRRWAIPEFSECATVFDCCPSIDDQVAVLRTWCAIPRVERIAYNDICFDMPSVIARVARQMGVAVDVNAVAASFADTKIVGQFNKGVKDRFHEMTARESSHFLEHYAMFYKRFMPSPAPSLHTGVPAGPHAASGQLRQIVTDLRRLWRNRVGTAARPGA